MGTAERLAEFVRSDRLVEEILNAALDAIIAIDADGRVLAFNRAAEEIFGYTAEEALGRPLADLIVPPSLRAAHWAGLVRMKAAGRPRLLGRRVELIAMRADGSEFPVELVVTRISHEPALFAGFIRDTSEQKRPAEAAARLQRLLDDAEDLAQIGSWEWDPSSDRVLWSDQLYRIHGYQPRSLVPTVDLAVERAHPDDRPELIEMIQRVRAGFPLPQTEYRLIRADGSVRTVVARVARKPGGLADGILVGTLQDVTERRAMERGLQSYFSVTQALVDWQPREDGLSGLLRRIGSSMDWAVGLLWTPEDGVLRWRSCWAQASVDPGPLASAEQKFEFPRGCGLPGRVWQTGEPAGVADVRDAADPRRDAAVRSGLRGVVAFPAVRANEVLAVFEFYSRDRLHLTPDFSRTLGGIGSQLGYLLERRIAALREPPLSDREREVLELAAEGLPTREIAGRLFIGPETVKSHFEKIYGKLGAPDRVSAVARALRQGLIE